MPTGTSPAGPAVIGNEQAGCRAAVPALIGPRRIVRTLNRVAPATARG